MADPSRVVILVALESEARAVARALKESDNAQVHVIGIGAKRVPALGAGARIVVMAGLAGALDPSLRAGDLVIDTPISGLSNDLPWHVGRIHTAEQLVSSPAEKASLFQQTGALVVDMEQAILWRAPQSGSQRIGLRAVSDPADMAIDPAVLRFINETGRPRPLTIASTLLRRPGLVPHLFALRSNSELALRNLSLGIRALLDRFPPDPAVAYAPPDSP